MAIDCVIFILCLFYLEMVLGGERVKVLGGGAQEDEVMQET